MLEREYVAREALAAEETCGDEAAAPRGYVKGTLEAGPPPPEGRSEAASWLRCAELGERLSSRGPSRGRFLESRRSSTCAIEGSAP